MTIGVGGSTADLELKKLTDMTGGVAPISEAEYHARLAQAQELMKAQGLAAVYLNAGTNMTYFTGTPWYASERMVGVILPAEGAPEYIAPVFEIRTLKDFMTVRGPVNGWEEHESPYALFGEVLRRMGIDGGKVGLDEGSSFFIFDGLRAESPDYDYINAKAVTAACRMHKSEAEIALMQRAKEMTMEVHKTAARILRPGISTLEVTDFINQAHQQVGAKGSSFCIVLFGEATAYPHGVKDPQYLKEGDMVLIDTGCLLHGYNSDITRTYVYGDPTARQREVWQHEKDAQLAAFEAAQLGTPCGEVDVAARRSLEANGYGPDYKAPGLVHRTGHGIGLDIHEWPYLVKSDTTPLAPGMCFSNEPMISIPGEFGVRLEDHFYMTEDGPRWFTQPSPRIDNPFGNN